jgi:maltose alpha-D-glucosyltransferase/alpha-amylase
VKHHPAIFSDADPLWFKDAIIYQLHVKSFFDANNDGIGDFKGLIQKLDYISELGVTAIWLLPFYPSPLRDDGYDIADYRGVHDEYGSLADLRRLISMAHDRGLRVITELVINHTSDQHPWFQRARHAKPGSAARNFYVWSDTDQRYADTRVIFLDTEKSNWTWDPEARAYFWHRFYSHQPDLNFDNPRVIEAVLSIMRFWLDLGVDGMRLDAVPYLVEREGTNNENLAETHAILKRIRAALDAHAPGRMLLAEANQWPEDAQLYFGEDDECHMAFHFPLMPRMYMAIAREDRFPITDIMRQTPEIPPNCQWAVFLRNHDELTLEMVTDGERDYLWETYAADRRARLNLGIRRRLAPLLEHDRRRIELMNGLLLSMPGTPVIYYGDEIGMGDNIHLGDRNGVRTPMQWSPDRNGGFSRSNPASLVLPLNMDPIYGYESVNVEAQAADQHSLLNWTRRMLAVRRRFRAFGRGEQKFLYPGNRKILAFLRILDDGTSDETLLCVSNLSRTAQAVELDLSGFAGRVPVDIVGGAVFPPVGALTYLLTLPPYGVYWFLLATEAALPPWHIRTPEVMPEFATLVLRHGISDIASGASRDILQHESLPSYLPKRRWFASKSESIGACRLAYACPMEFAGQTVLLAEIEIDLAAHKESYLLPLAIGWDDAITPALAQQLALARIRYGRRVGVLTDGFAIDTLAFAVIDALKRSAKLDIEIGTLEFLPTSRMESLTLSPDAEIRRLSAEQSNSSLVIDDSLVLKLVRHVAPGIHPESEMTRFLTERGFANTAPLFGEVQRVSTDGTPHCLMIVQGFVRNQGDGWGWTLDYLARTVEELALTGPDADTADDEMVVYDNFATILGRRLGELHALLSTPCEEEDFAPKPVDPEVLESWAAGAIEQWDGALLALEEFKSWPDEASKVQAAALISQRAAMAKALRGLAARGSGALQTRVHGDFHLGQVLVVQDDVFLIDFEGEPARSLLQRRQKSCPLRDVAGLLRSFDYAAAAAAPGRAAVSPQVAERRLSLLAHFRARAEECFLRSYRSVLATAPTPWVPLDTEISLLDLFLVEKASYEVRYEAANRPDWLPIPLHGLSNFADRLLVQGV